MHIINITVRGLAPDTPKGEAHENIVLHPGATAGKVGGGLNDHQSP